MAGPSPATGTLFGCTGSQLRNRIRFPGQPCASGAREIIASVKIYLGDDRGGGTMGRTEPGADLVAVDLACRRGDRLVFAGLSFRLPAGGALVLRGANGSGKTSLLRLLAGLIAPA